jgi:hypothetical protein
MTLHPNRNFRRMKSSHITGSRFVLQKNLPSPTPGSKTALAADCPVTVSDCLVTVSDIKAKKVPAPRFPVGNPVISELFSDTQDPVASDIRIDGNPAYEGAFRPRL